MLSLQRKGRHAVGGDYRNQAPDRQKAQRDQCHGLACTELALAYRGHLVHWNIIGAPLDDSGSYFRNLEGVIFTVHGHDRDPIAGFQQLRRIDSLLKLSQSTVDRSKCRASGKTQDSNP